MLGKGQLRLDSLLNGLHHPAECSAADVPILQTMPLYEHELDVITQFPLESVKQGLDALLLQLAPRHTACLAMEKCLPSPAPSPLTQFKPLPTFSPTTNK